MTKLKSVHLSNFQKHSDLTINFTEGVNTIFGKSDAGKSAIRRAIEWVLNNQKIDGIRKVNTKLTSVRITLQDGIEIEKIRSASINRYILRVNKEEKIFDAIGKTVPDEIKAVIGNLSIELDDEEILINSTPQVSLPFLFDKSPTQRMKLFNKLTGNDLLDKLFVQFNKDTLKINRELKETKESLQNQEQILKDKEIEKDRIEFRYSKAQKLMNGIEALKKILDNHLILNELWKSNYETLETVSKAVEAYKIPEDIDIKGFIEKNDRLKVLNILKTTLDSTQNLDSITDQLSKITLPAPQFIEESRLKIDRLAKLRDVKEKLEINTGTLDRLLTIQVPDVILNIEKMEEEFKAKLKELQICYVCGQKI